MYLILVQCFTVFHVLYKKNFFAFYERIRSLLRWSQKLGREVFLLKQQEFYFYDNAIELYLWPELPSISKT